MELKSLLTDDEAVSPVIGVILMVAITVILAAVIASFVLGLGSKAANTNPQASFGFSYEEHEPSSNEGILKISHNSGDAINQDELYVRGAGFIGSSGDQIDNTGIDGGSYYMYQAGKWQGKTTGSDSQVVAGNYVYVGVKSDFEIDVVYESLDGSSSTTLGSAKGPDA